MADVKVKGQNRENAILLLAAAEESKDFDRSAVRTVSGGYLVPEEIAKAAGLSDDVADDATGNTKAEDDQQPDRGAPLGDSDGGTPDGPSVPAPAKKAPAKKTAAKKTTAKKTTTAKKAAATPTTKE